MKARDVVGRKIVKVNQTRFWNEHGGGVEVALDSLELDNGKRLYFIALESETEPYTIGKVTK